MSHLTTEQLYRRVGGRRGYNKRRLWLAERRRVAVAQRLIALGWQHGVQARIAHEFGVSQATISRDVRHALERLRLASAFPALLHEPMAIAQEYERIVRRWPLVLAMGVTPREAVKLAHICPPSGWASLLYPQGKTGLRDN